MAHLNRKPPIKVTVDIETYNKLVEYISSLATTDENDRATKLRDKLLRYSIPYTSDENKELVNIRFFPNEVENLFYILFNMLDDVIVKNNYYEVLLKVRESLKEKYNKGE